MSTATKMSEQQCSPLNERKLRERHSDARRRFRKVACALTLVLSDLLAIAISLELGILLRIHLIPHLDKNIAPLTLSFRHYVDLGWLWLVPIVFAGVEGLYTRRRSLWSEIGQLMKAISLGLVSILATIGLTQLSSEVSRTTILLMGMNLFILMPAMRIWTKKNLGALGLWRKKILILGATDTARLVMRGLTSDPVLGYEVAGIVDNDPTKIGKCFEVCEGKSVFVLGSLSKVLEIMEQENITDVLVAMPQLAEGKFLLLLHQLQPHCDNIYVVPQSWGLPMMNLQVEGLLGERLMMLKLSNNLTKPWNISLKRIFDLVVGTAVGLVALPLCAVLGILIKMDSEGPVLFVQERLGYLGGKFRCIKFRTMDVNGDVKLAKYLEGNPPAAEEWRKYAKLRTYDPRVTRLGRFLRRWSFDELPQLLNVLKGEMSLVGPRPYIPQERHRIGADLTTILSARPGMTGLWQVSGRNEMTLEDRVQLEAWYVRNWNLWLDCIVLAKTFGAVLFPHKGTEVADLPEPGATALEPVVPLAIGSEREELPEADSVMLGPTSPGRPGAR
jgi:Undecaprenyl-phosphate galactose phosphotransferase WbaP